MREDLALQMKKKAAPVKRNVSRKPVSKAISPKVRSQVKAKAKYK
jgi:hypothetical protein